MNTFTGFPSRGGAFGIRRLNVSFGLGPQGGTAAVTAPGSAAGAVAALGAVGASDAPTASGEPALYTAAGTVEIPTAAEIVDECGCPVPRASNGSGPRASSAARTFTTSSKTRKPGPE